MNNWATPMNWVSSNQGVNITPTIFETSLTNSTVSASS